MNTSSTRLKLSVITMTLALFIGLERSSHATPPKEGDTFPDLAGFGLEGAIPDLHGKVVIVDFFASWCEPCKESFPVMEELKQKYGDKVVIVAVNVDKKKADMEAFLKKYPASFTVVRDATSKLVNEVKIPTMPSSFVLDKNGKVHSFHRGFKGAETKKKYIEEIDLLLK